MEEDFAAAQMSALEAEISQLRQARARNQGKASKQLEDAQQSLRLQVSDLQRQLAFAQSQLQTKDKELAQLHTHLHTLKSTEIHKNADISDLKAQLSVALEQNQSLRNTLENSQMALKTLQSEHQTLTLRAENAAKIQSEEIQLREKQFFQLITEKDTQLMGLNQEVLTLKVENQKIKELNAHIMTMQTEKQQLKVELQALKRKFESISQNPDPSEVSKLIEDRVKSAEFLYFSTLQDKISTIESQEKQIRSLQFEIQTCKQSLMHEKTLKMTENAANKREIEFIREKYEQEMSHLQEINQKQWENMQKNHQIQVEKLTEMINNKKKPENLTSERNEMKQIEDLKSEIANLRREISKKDQEMSQKDFDLLQKQQEVMNLKTKLSLDSHLMSDKEELRMELDYVTSRLRILEVENARLQAELKEASEPIKRSSLLSLDSPDLKGSLRKLWESKSPAQSVEFKGLEQENAQLKEIIAEMRTEMESIQSRLSNERVIMTEKHLQSTQRIQELESQRDSLTSQLSTQQTAYLALENE